ncbi:Satratoxin biosynthesis SC1 cluster protein [Lachnellula suecica]|uniref:Satratoxin biosynthesis SC1 cluster protein n=1 Tax=Lachnellula suecica TaxID=602035 RepID=A0A8T9BXV1_9HELO|nr:Satratoxin biosynthesis SC1 cluster protein [Lachnellula suecica]
MSSEENLQSWVVATVASVTVLAFVSVCLRLLSRYEKQQKLWWDDWLIIWSLLWNFAVVGFILGMMKAGMGIHAKKVPMGNIVLMAKLLVVAEILYAWNLIWTKISLLMMYYRIFRFPYFKRWAFIIGIFVGLWAVTVTFLFIFICVPVQKLWYPDIPGHCINQVGTWIANATSTIVSDLAILVLPIPQVWKLKLRRSEKIALTGVFGLGFFIVFASVYRFTVLFTYSSADPTYTLAPTVGWTAIEMSAGIVSACLPTVRPGLLLIFRRLGIKGNVPGLFRSGNSTDVPKLNGPSHLRHETHGLGTIGSAQACGPRGDKKDFYRLSDDLDLPVDLTLRPDHKCTQAVTSTSEPQEVDSLSGDEVPLHAIHVRKDVSQIRE